MRSSRSYERQIDKLLAIIEKQNDRLMYLAGRTWEPPPVEEHAATITGDPLDRYVMSPSDDFTADF